MKANTVANLRIANKVGATIGSYLGGPIVNTIGNVVDQQLQKLPLDQVRSTSYKGDVFSSEKAFDPKYKQNILEFNTYGNDTSAYANKVDKAIMGFDTLTGMVGATKGNNMLSLFNNTKASGGKTIDNLSKMDSLDKPFKDTNVDIFKSPAYTYSNFKNTGYDNFNSGFSISNNMNNNIYKAQNSLDKFNNLAR